MKVERSRLCSTFCIAKNFFVRFGESFFYTEKKSFFFVFVKLRGQKITKGGGRGGRSLLLEHRSEVFADFPQQQLETGTRVLEAAVAGLALLDVALEYRLRQRLERATVRQAVEVRKGD